MRSKILVLGLLLFFAGLPVLVLFSLVTSSVSAEAWSGSQPGGTVRVSVHTKSGEPIEGAEVEASLARWADAQPSRGLFLPPDLGVPSEELLATQLTGAGGVLDLTLPPHEGFYIVRCDGREHWFSFLDESGRTKPAQELAFELEGLSRAAGSPPDRAPAPPSRTPPPSGSGR